MPSAISSMRPAASARSGRTRASGSDRRRRLRDDRRRQIFTERKLAGRALMKEILSLVQLQHEDETVIASIGGFDLVFRPALRTRTAITTRPCFGAPARSSKSSLPVTVTPLGAIARPRTRTCRASRTSRRPTGTASLTRAAPRLLSFARGRGVFAFAAELGRQAPELGEDRESLAEDAVAGGERAAA